MAIRPLLSKDERHRIVASGVFELPGGIQFSPIMQFATARPYSLNVGIDNDGDGLATVDSGCQLNSRVICPAT